MQRQQLKVLSICLSMVLTINLFTLHHYSLLFSTRRHLSKSLLYSGIHINSFNPPLVHLTFNTYITSFNRLSIIENNVTLIQLSTPLDTLPIKMILSDGYHHLDILISDENRNKEFHQDIDISVGSHSVHATILDQQNKSVENVSVRLSLVDHSHISLEHNTNRFGEVTFRHLPRSAVVYIDAKCMSSKRHAFIEIDTLHYRSITLILKNMSTLNYDEYDPLDQGFYAI